MCIDTPGIFSSIIAKDFVFNSQTPTIASANHPTETNRLQAPRAEFVDSTNAKVTRSITAIRTPSAEICRMDTVAGEKHKP